MNNLEKNPPEIRHDARVLLIAVSKGAKHERHFFTPKKNLPYLIEFARAFDARIEDVRVKKATVLSLHHLVKAFCDSQYHEKAEYKVIKTTDLTRAKVKLIQKQPKRQNKIMSRIRSLLLKGTPISTKSLYKKLEKEGMSDSTIRRYYQTVRTELSKQGYQVDKIERGKYQIS
jgi:hypothetical protein